MSSTKRIVLIAASAGAGFALILSLIVGAYIWDKSRPKPWNAAAIVARFDDIDTTGPDEHLVFYYVLENTTGSDYRSRDRSSITIMATRKEDNSLIALPGVITIDAIESIPARQRLRVAIHFPSRTSTDFYSSALRALDAEHAEARKRTTVERWEDIEFDDATTRQAENKYIQNPAAIVNQNFGKLNGFVVFDNVNHLQIDCPKGW